MERQCWANAEYSRRECMEILGIPSSVCRNQLDKLKFSVVKDNLDDCHR